MLPYLPFSLIVSKAGWCNRSFRYQKFDIVGFVCHKAWEMPRRVKFFSKRKGEHAHKDFDSISFHGEGLRASVIFI